MVMSWIWTGCMAVSLLCSAIHGNGQALAASLLTGAQAGIQLATAMAGSLCLWAGVGKLLDAAGITDLLAALLKPGLHRLFPGTKADPALARSVSGNICANFLGLGNAATPMGIQAAKLMRKKARHETATDEMCRLVVMNTASIQLLPTTVAALRLSAGCRTPWDILPCVWISSILSVTAGLCAAEGFRRFWKDA